MSIELIRTTAMGVCNNCGRRFNRFNENSVKAHVHLDLATREVEFCSKNCYNVKMSNLNWGESTFILRVKVLQEIVVREKPLFLNVTLGVDTEKVDSAYVR